jgi:ribonuclease-3
MKAPVWTLFDRRPELFSGLDQLEKVIDYRFKNRAWLVVALTHKSALASLIDSGQTNLMQDRPWSERLEFLGDGVLGLVVAESLMDSGKVLSEGQMSRLRSQVVCERSLASIAESHLLLERFVVLGPSEQSSSRVQPSILADIVEALFGAIYSDGGWLEARKVIRSFITPALHVLLDESVTLDHVTLDHKTQLQELVQAKYRATPTYRVARELGPPHDRTFEVEAVIDLNGQTKVWGLGVGPSKKAAAQLAASEAVAKFRQEILV